MRRPTPSGFQSARPGPGRRGHRDRRENMFARPFDSAIFIAARALWSTKCSIVTNVTAAEHGSAPSVASSSLTGGMSDSMFSSVRMASAHRRAERSASNVERDGPACCCASSFHTWQQLTELRNASCRPQRASRGARGHARLGRSSPFSLGAGSSCRRLSLSARCWPSPASASTRHSGAWGLQALRAPPEGSYSVQERAGAGCLAELNTCTPASLSPSNGVMPSMPGAAGAEVIVGGIGEPHADLVEVHADALAVDDHAREGLVARWP